MSDNLHLRDLYDKFEQFSLVEGTTKKKCKAAFNKLINWDMAIQASELTTMHVEAWQKWMQDSGMANASVHSYFGAASQVYKWAQKKKLISENPFIGAEKIRREKPTVKIWSPDEVEDLSDAAAELSRMDPTAKIRWVAMIDLASHSALRVGEIWNLRWEDIDLDNEAVRICSRADIPGVQWQWGAKGKKDREVPIFENALMALYRLKTMATWRYPFLRQKACERLQGLVGELTEYQRKYPYNNFYRDLKQIRAFADGKRSAMDKAPISDGGMHVLRHTAVSWWLSGDNKVSIKEAQTVAGHASELTTLRIYAHTNNQAAMSSVRKSLSTC